MTFDWVLGGNIFFRCHEKETKLRERRKTKKHSRREKLKKERKDRCNA